MTSDSSLGANLFDMTGLSAKAARARSRRGSPALVIVLSVALVGLGAGLAYSLSSASAWHEIAVSRATELGAAQRQRDDVKAQLAGLQGELSDTRQQLTDLTDQTNGATSQVPSLTGGSAQAGDQAAYFAELVALAGTVTQELGTCVTEVQTMSSYLTSYQGQDMTNLTGFARQVDADCSVAGTDHATLAQRLATQ